MEFITNVPGVAEITGDLVAKTQDWKNADKFAERIKKTIPPEIIGDEDQDEETLSILLAQSKQENKLLTQQLDQALALIQSKELDMQMVERKEQGAMQREIVKSQTALQKEQISTAGDIKEEQIKAQSEIIQALIEKTESLNNKLQGLTQIVIERGSQPPANGLNPFES
jgi:hypothetical protein